MKTTFLHGNLKEEIYMSYLEGFEVKGKEDLVCRLKKSLYGLKQSPRMWYQKFDTHMLELGFICSKAYHCIYFKQVRDHFVILLLYVDDILLVGNNKEMIKGVKSQLSSQFEMKDLGATKFILSIN